MLASAVFSAAMKELTSVCEDWDGGLLGGDGGLGLDALDVGEDSALLDAVTFLDVEVGDAAEGLGADVDVGLGLDLAGAADDGDEVLLDDLAGGHFGDIGLPVQDRADDDASEDQYGDDDKDDLLGAHSGFLCRTLIGLRVCEVKCVCIWRLDTQTPWIAFHRRCAGERSGDDRIATAGAEAASRAGQFRGMIAGGLGGDDREICCGRVARRALSGL